MGSISGKAKSIKLYNWDESRGEKLFIIGCCNIGPMTIDTICVDLREENERDEKEEHGWKIEYVHYGID